MQVRAAGLLDRRLGYYSAKVVLTLAAFAAVWVAFFWVGAAWMILGVAVLLGVMSTQLGFLGHDAGHRQIFASRRANELLGLLVGNALIGLSFGWWVPKHSAHHAHPNQIDLDPDIEVGVVRAPSADEQAGGHHRFTDWLGRWQAELFFPLMLLRSTGLYVLGAKKLFGRRDRAALTEGLLLALHVALYLTAVFWVLPPLMAFAFVAVHQAVFSLYLGCSFAPNHKGMPLIDRDAEMSFASRQVITARNVTGGRWTSFVYGGLNYQIEHHLFPSMPRPNLVRAQDLVRGFCVENGLGYCEKSPIGSYRQAIGHLRLARQPALSSV
ncbi:MAG TPA: acyl-CoA desaturase [Acidimicrobiales bacterium]|nr:acyl-CoA desaturase [Acidimicrobiales bacterium]